MIRIYLAGPDVFLADAVEVGRRKKAMCRERGFEGLFPLDQDTTLQRADDIFRANTELMRQADIGLFNLSPFRGPSADAGTAFELGFMFALGKRVLGYSSASADYARRVASSSGPLVDRDGQLWAADGYAVEGFGLIDNLMITESIRERGGEIFAAETDGGEPGDRLAAFRAFAQALASIKA